MRAIGWPELLIIVVLLWFLPAYFASVVADRRGGNGALWAVLGFLGGPFFAWLVFLLSLALNHHQRCPACRMRIDRKASICPHCKTVMRQEAAV